MEHEHLGELGEEQLLRTSALSTVVTLPLWNARGANCLGNRIRDRLLFLRGGNRELRERIGFGFLVRAVIAANCVRNPEP